MANTRYQPHKHGRSIDPCMLAPFQAQTASGTQRSRLPKTQVRADEAQARLAELERLRLERHLQNLAEQDGSSDGEDSQDGYLIVEPDGRMVTQPSGGTTTEVEFGASLLAADE